ncbi:MAG: SHOCT domain-containing protein [Halodesulfurarchaeum sp.]
MSESGQLNSTKILVLLIGGILLIPLVSMGGGFMGAGGMMGGGMFLWPILFLGVIAWHFYRSRTRTGSGSQKTALTELRERYARGDISEEEFEKRRETLQLRD